VRLQRYLALAGIASRRAAEELIVAGRVSVNGSIVRELGSKVEDDSRVAVDGRPVRMPNREVLVLHKPAGVVTTMHDPEGRRTVDDIVRAARGENAARLVPVGRLDYDTSGLLLLTNDGDLAFALTHPRFGVDKVYRATLQGRLESDAVERLRKGIMLEGRRTAPATLRVVAASRDRSTVDLTLHEGRYRQVRRMFEAVGHPLIALTRLRFGPVSLGSLRPAQTRELTPSERKALDVLLLNSRREDGRAAQGSRNSRRDAGKKRRR
jgi:23S rRNA pseudouridine2605 synthase